MSIENRLILLEEKLDTLIENVSQLEKEKEHFKETCHRLYERLVELYHERKRNGQH